LVSPGGHPHLPSVPTRRSSDLDGRQSSGVLVAAAAGTPVTAVADGTVVFAEWMTGYGLILIVDHGNGYMSLYAHNDTLLKSPGEDRKSTRLNSSHVKISYAVFC